MDRNTLELLTRSRPAFFQEGVPVQPLQAATLPPIQQAVLEGRARRSQPVRAEGYSAGQLSSENVGGLPGIAVAIFGVAAVLVIAGKRK